MIPGGVAFFFIVQVVAYPNKSGIAGFMIFTYCKGSIPIDQNFS